MEASLPPNEEHCAENKSSRRGWMKLCEVASQMFVNDFTSPENTVNIQNGNSSPRKSGNNCDKLTLDQIARLSEKNLIDYFSEQTSDEMKKNYSYKCFLIPENCSATFKSFGNEERARYKMKEHLMSHIEDLFEVDAVIPNIEMFLAEPLHIRKKRLREYNQRNPRKKRKPNKQVKVKKNDALDLSNSAEDYILLKDQYSEAFADKSVTSEMYYSNFNSDKSLCMPQNIKYKSTSSYNSLPYFPEYNPVFSSSKKCVMPGAIDINVDFAKNLEKRKRSKPYSCITSTSTIVQDSFMNFNADYTGSCSRFKFDLQSTFETPHAVHHDHSYTSVNGKTMNFDVLSSVECRESKNALWDPFNPMKMKHHHCEIPDSLVIVTPPFPYVYVPMHPHHSNVQEIGSSTRSYTCKCKSDYSDRLRSFNGQRHVPLFLKLNTSRNDPFKNSRVNFESTPVENTDTAEKRNVFSHYFVEDIINAKTVKQAMLAGFDQASTVSNVHLPDVPFIDNVLIPYDKNYAERQFALECIRELDSRNYVKQAPMTCGRCKSKNFTAQSTSVEYRNKNAAAVKSFSCSGCKATFTRQHSLNYHISNYNNKSRFVCVYCRSSFRHADHLNEHLKTHNGETSMNYNLK